jgi:hypothetical protein
MSQVLERLGKNVTDQQLAGLVSGPNKSTSLYALRQFARGLGLHCRAVKTNPRTLKNLKNCQAILHLSRANHYVVFEYIDDKYIWLIDLDSNKFFYRTNLKEFSRNWNTGVALLVSDKPLDVDPNNTPINDSELHKIIGEGGVPNFSCSEVIQEYNVILCPPRIGLCGGAYHHFYNRCGCKEDPNGTGCHSVLLPGVTSCLCIEDPDYPGDCMLDPDCIAILIRACDSLSCFYD